MNKAPIPPINGKYYACRGDEVSVNVVPNISATGGCLVSSAPSTYCVTITIPGPFLPITHCQSFLPGPGPYTIPVLAPTGTYTVSVLVYDACTSSSFPCAECSTRLEYPRPGQDPPLKGGQVSIPAFQDPVATGALWYFGGDGMSLTTPNGSATGSTV